MQKSPEGFRAFGENRSLPPNLIGLNGANAQFFTQSDTVKALHFYTDATGIATNL